MSSIIKPRVVNSLLINNELGQDFITHYSSAPIYGRYGKQVFSMPTHLPINFSINGKSNSILPNYLNNKLKFKYLIGDIDMNLYKYISKLIFDNPQLYNEFTEEDILDEIIVSILNEKNKFNNNLSTDAILDDPDFPIVYTVGSPPRLFSTEEDEDEQFENYLTAEIAKVTYRSNKIKY